MGSAMNSIAVIILAAGKGTRMKSDKAKVLHELNGKPMIRFVVETARQVADDRVIVVVGHQADQVERVVRDTAPTRFCVQHEQKGTGHAVICAMPEIPEGVKSIVILCGDVPLIRPETIRDLVKKHQADDCAVTVLTVNVDRPKGYGRIVSGENGAITRIVEEADADEDEKKITLVNAGIYCVDRDFLDGALSQINDNNAQGELYLTDIIGIAHDQNKTIGMSLCESQREVIGVNTCDDLVNAQKLLTVRP
jgi:bifunctional UDP-N-acetylglucosamine pyrophosphorylase/glucosamine-1-phosphate N-acetyltransferase/UDP-N-acetylglucosamine pyrophosphorylase